MDDPKERVDEVNDVDAVRYDVSAPITSSTWTPTGMISQTASRGVWLTDVQAQRTALMKPGVPTAGNLEPLREYVASVLGKWLAVRVPEVELLMHASGPAAISIAPAKSIVTWQTVMIDPVGAAARPAAIADLNDYTGVIVLDAILAAQDRLNPGNLLYSEDRREWFSIDYSYSFGTTDRTTACGDRDAPHSVSYFPEIVRAVASNDEPLRRSLARAVKMPDKALEDLFAGPPALFADAQSRGQMLAFIKHRRSQICDLVKAWCQSVGVASVKL